MSVMSRFRRTNISNRRGQTNPPINTNHLSASEYARRCKLILELRADVQNLELGTDDLEFNFPRLVVIGDQSSGKSSLVEAVSGINVPRDSGTCTRCPMECFMRSTTDLQWSCSISIRSQQGPVPFAPIIYDRSSVELWIRRAQAAVLSPHRPHTDFLTKSEHELKNEVDPRRLQFSKQSVLVEIKDPQSPDLDFVDLPGIVHAVDPPSLEEDVIDLVEHFIAPENTIILIAMPVTSDWQIQAAVRLARHADPYGDRTIGILTKPDALQEGDLGSRETWKNILANRDPERKTKHGYYCVRLPNDLERRRGITREEALNLADDFFNSYAPWNEMDDRSRCGIPNFVKNISALLIERIEKYLPALAEKVDHFLNLCLKDIAGLPPISEKAPSTEIHLRISAFCYAFKDAVFGRDHRSFVQNNKRRYLRFSEEIALTKPNYITSHSTTMSHPVISHSPTMSLRSTMSMLEVDVDQSVRTGPCMDLTQVRRVKEGTITWELSPHVPFEATVQLVEMYTSMWEDPSLECFDDVVKHSIKLGETLLHTHFGQYNALLNLMRQLTSEERGRCRDEARRILKKILQFESKPLFTQNHEFLHTERMKWLNAYRYDTRSDHPVYYERRYYKENHQELELMADAYSYFQVAHKRIIDYVPLTIEHELNQMLVGNLEIFLVTSITRENETPGRLEELVQEDPAVTNLRGRLQKRRSDLERIKRKIQEFWSLSNVPSQHLSSGSNGRRNSSASDYHSTVEP